MSNYIHMEEIDSTSAYLKRNYNDYENFTFLSCDYQSNGHGRSNKKWYSNKKENLLFSILIKDKKIISDYSSLSLVSAKAIMDVLVELGVNNVSYKWPNDVYVNDKKISGILLEGISFNGMIEAIIVGVGINVNSSDFDLEIKDKATSIYLENQTIFDIEKLKYKFYKSFESNIDNINDKKYLSYLRDNNYLLSKNVYVLKDGKKALVKVMDINDNNSLKVNLDGEILDIYSGEVTFFNE